MRKDGVIDMNEWTQTFKQTEGAPGLSDSPKFDSVLTMIAKNRKFLLEACRKHETQKGYMSTE